MEDKCKVCGLDKQDDEFYDYKKDGIEFACWECCKGLPPRATKPMPKPTMWQPSPDSYVERAYQQAVYEKYFDPRR